MPKNPTPSPSETDPVADPFDVSASPDVLLDRTYRETAVVDIDRLTKMPGNARRGDIDAIKDSMLTNGVFDSPIVRRHRTDDGVQRLTILAGNHTYMAARELGLTKLRVDIHECNDAEALRINVSHNRTQQLGGFDERALLDQLEQLNGDFAGTGFSAEDYVKMMNKADFGNDPDMGGDDAPTDEGQKVWGVVVECDTEGQQAILLEALMAEGHRVRALM